MLTKSAAADSRHLKIVMSSTEKIIWTAGYGGRTIDTFLNILTAFHIDAVVDIRAVPLRRCSSQISLDELREALDLRDIRFHQAGHQLGSIRKTSEDSPHIALNKALRGFAEHMSTDVFKQGVKQLTSLTKQMRVMLVTQYDDYEKCHRKLLADYLLLTEGYTFIHILGSNLVEKHSLTNSVRFQFDSIVYDGFKEQNLVVH